MTQLVPHSQARSLAHLDHTHSLPNTQYEPRIGRYVTFGMFVLLAFVGGALYWSFASKLDGAVVAPASFVVEGNRKTVEHIDGGTIRAILISDGEFVEQGQPLIRLDSTDIDVDMNVLGSQLGELSVRRARLLAQINGRDAFVEADAMAQLQPEVNRLHWYSAFLTQKQLFDTEARARRTEMEIASQRILSLKDQVSGLEEQRDSTRRQLEITKEELAGLQQLYDQGLVTVPRISARRVEVERLAGVDASLRTQIAQAENQARELELTRVSAQKLRDEAIANELAAVEAQLALVTPQFAGAAERRKRIEILAPSSGRVVNLEVSTTGGVIRPGEPILDIVPADQELIVEARVKTADIDKLQIGQQTRIRLSAFAQADVPEATGQIFDISADALEDDRTGEEFYMARVKLDADQPTQVAELDLLPGMPADLFVRTGERTAFSYLAQPISDRLARTFIE
ncbi:HlyD family type I secretion periplasmic adaptor subunit [Roseovarius rhodophyticola]|uniref:Membrane fusion protein (MFP) family protein n=1 Tax=Roseovarius rhodophyticola TaxID=3080827 RepID=A0ABZ2TAM7_9RHOB|nr:HlyD family type I secretion periplasmic adaptor subunit [Roseovarius sp. W115]MDV2930447.1 HlyD family type I secretion periplasmic adaptor subunit [Roseovarius sp. W115]